MFLGKSAQDDEDEGDAFRSLARERKSEGVGVAIEPSGTILASLVGRLAKRARYIVPHCCPVISRTELAG